MIMSRGISLALRPYNGVAESKNNGAQFRVCRRHQCFYADYLSRKKYFIDEPAAYRCSRAPTFYATDESI